MKALLLVLLFALSSCNFSGELMQFTQCIVKSQKVKEYLPKILEAIKTKNFQNILKVGFLAFKEIKAEVKECFYSEPVLKGCKNTLAFGWCCDECPHFYGRAQCVQNCMGKYC